MYRFNIFSWALFILYIAVVVTMESFSHRVSFEGLCITFPLIGTLIFWSETIFPCVRKSDKNITKKEAFYRDLFLIWFGVLSGYLLYLLFQYNNSDARGWWPIIIYLITGIGIIYGFFFSIIASVLNEHKKYTVVFSIILASLLMCTCIWSYFYPNSVLAKSDNYYSLLLILIGIHLFISLLYKKRDSHSLR